MDCRQYSFESKENEISSKIQEPKNLDWKTRQPKIYQEPRDTRYALNSRQDSFGRKGSRFLLEVYAEVHVLPLFKRDYIRASLRHLFIWTRRQITVSPSNMSNVLVPFYSGADCWCQVSWCTPLKWCLTTNAASHVFSRSHGTQQLGSTDRETEDAAKIQIGQTTRTWVHRWNWCLSIHFFVTLEFLSPKKNCWHLPIVFSLISTGKKEKGIERRIQASKNHSRKTSGQETGKIRPAWIFCVEQDLAFQSRLGPQVEDY